MAFRVIDTGLREGRSNIAFDEAMIELHRAGEIPDTIRFLRFEPSALVGRHQAIGRELNVEYCRDNGIGLVRRITGGGAIYLDPGQLGWELVISRARLPLPTLAAYATRICESAADGLARTFGIDARFRPRNDIEVDGRKISGTGGFFDGDTLFYQGTVLIDADPSRVMAALNVPRAKLEKHGLDRPESRIVTLKELLGQAPEVATVQRALIDGLALGLGLDAIAGESLEVEERRATELHDADIGRDAFVFEIDARDAREALSASVQSAGGTVHAALRIEGEGGARRIREALITGDFFVTPPRLVMDLEAKLRGVQIDEAGAAVMQFFAACQPDLISIAPSDFRDAVEAALTGSN